MASKASPSPDHTLLNAVPGVDDEEGACYLGDGPLDIVDVYAGQIAEMVGDCRFAEEEAWRLVAERVTPPSFRDVEPVALADILQGFEQMWADVDWCYEEDWGRPARREAGGVRGRRRAPNPALQT
jgi:hypothetical protein